MHCGFGCRLYLAGLPRGTVYESQPCQKGWPTVSSVGHEELLQHLSCLHEFRVCEQLGAKDDVPEPTMLAHWCTLRGLSVGKLDLVNVPHPTHARSRRVTWRSTGGVYKRSTTFPRDHLCACACGNRPPARDIPVATTIPARPPQRIHKPLRSVPGITRDSRMSACPPPDAPRRGHHVGYRILWAEGWWFEVTVVPGVTVGEPGPRT